MIAKMTVGMMIEFLQQFPAGLPLMSYDEEYGEYYFPDIPETEQVYKVMRSRTIEYKTKMHADWTMEEGHENLSIENFEAVII
jgi:hypothetical protein